jgi:tetratricopeptide (TPR) repeat protein
MIALVLAGSLAVFTPRVLAANSITEYNQAKQGVEAYQDKDFAAAAQHFGKAQASNPDANVHHMNLGDALLKSGAPEAAIPEFQAVTKSPVADEAAKGAYNLGKAYETQKNLEQAIRSYQLGLDKLRDSPDANLQTELKLKRALEIAQQQKQQQQKQGGEGKAGGENDKDQKNKDQDQGDKDQPKQYNIGRQKPQFKAEKLAEPDAKRILQQMQEQEKKSQQHVMRNKTGKPKNDKNLKDW